MDLSTAEQCAFKTDEVTKIVTQAIEQHLKNLDFDEKRVNQWVNDICETTTEKLFSLKKPFKYIVTCVIMQRTGAALHSAHAAHWDAVSDGAVSVCWPKRNTREPSNRSIICLTTVFATSFYPS